MLREILDNRPVRLGRSHRQSGKRGLSRALSVPWISCNCGTAFGPPNQHQRRVSDTALGQSDHQGPKAAAYRLFACRAGMADDINLKRHGDAGPAASIDHLFRFVHAHIDRERCAGL